MVRYMAELLGGGEGAQDIHAKIVQAAKKGLKIKMTKGNTGNEAETKNCFGVVSNSRNFGGVTSPRR